MRRWPVQGIACAHAVVAGQRVRVLRPDPKLGVAKEEATNIVAHAWLVLGGKSLVPTSGRSAELRVSGG